MARRRMINVDLVESDKFLDMSASAQNLYFHLCMKADDDGFIDNLKSLQRYYAVQDKIVNELVDNGLIMKFSDSDCVISHWKMSNYIQKHKYRPSVNAYKSKVELKDNIYVKSSLSQE